MQIIITEGWALKGRTVYLSGLRLAFGASVFILVLTLVLAGLLRFSLWTSGAQLPAYASSKQDLQTRQNLQVMARQMGELSAKLSQIEALAERVSGLAGLSLSNAKSSAKGGPLISLESLDTPALARALAYLGQRAEQQQDLMIVLETRLLDDHLRKLMLPTQFPVLDHAMGSRFGWRPDPLTGQSALHTGLDFPANPGTTVVASAGGLVVAQEFHPAYGNLLELDHGNDVLTRYAHLSRTLVKKGDLVRRGQRIAEVGNSGRSTGPHLHFEVLVQGVYQNPELFLSLGHNPVTAQPPK